MEFVVDLGSLKHDIGETMERDRSTHDKKLSKELTVANEWRMI